MSIPDNGLTGAPPCTAGPGDIERSLAGAGQVSDAGSPELAAPTSATAASAPAGSVATAATAGKANAASNPDVSVVARIGSIAASSAARRGRADKAVPVWASPRAAGETGADSDTDVD